ncbi:MAG: hypothetical protein JWN86_1200 [Planctomycetota bacterium]|nr:hypothetical protein [Planctomycetota bacterium]
MGSGSARGEDDREEPRISMVLAYSSETQIQNLVLTNPSTRSRSGSCPR